MKEVNNFEIWMRDVIHNIHFANKESMSRAYEKILENSKTKSLS